MADDESAMEIELLRAQVATLEQLLTVHEEVERERAERMEQMIEELKKRADELAASEAALRRQSTILHWMLDNMTDGLVVLDEAGTHLLSNKAAEDITRDLPIGLPRAGDHAASEDVRIFLADGRTPCPKDKEPLVRALRGTEVRDVELFIRRPERGLFVSVNATPLRDDSGIRGAIAVFRDVTERKREQDELEAKRRQLFDAERARNEALLRLQESQADLIRRQEIALEELSTPVLDIWDDILALPIIGTIDSSRSAQIMERLLGEIVAKRCRWVIVDVTGVDVVDTQTASHFLRMASAVELLGSTCILTGLRPAVAQTLVQLDVDLGRILTLRNLKHGLLYCVRKKEGFDPKRGSRSDQSGSAAGSRARASSGDDGGRTE